MSLLIKIPFFTLLLVLSFFPKVAYGDRIKFHTDNPGDEVQTWIGKVVKIENNVVTAEFKYRSRGGSEHVIPANIHVSRIHSIEFNNHFYHPHQIIGLRESVSSPITQRNINTIGRIYITEEFKEFYEDRCRPFRSSTNHDVVIGNILRFDSLSGETANARMQIICWNRNREEVIVRDVLRLHHVERWDRRLP